MSLAAAVATIEEAAAALGVALAPDDAAWIARFGELVLHWNRRVRLVGPSDLATLARDHLVDALGFVRAIRAAHAPAWWDVGAGAGLPGLVLARLLPEVRFDLVEPTGKKAAFITHAATTLGLTNARAHALRDDQLPPGGARAALSRATFAPEVWAARGQALVGPAGVVLVALGAVAAPEVEARAAFVDRYTLPGSGAARTNLLLLGPEHPGLAP
ncbi:MAG: class I SAM-dependent methyltransferase [Myxococcales bacterium]|nr:class I SAM-dependent methyltransferase [Myxococcales bacterium]MCB9734393.1 class I SAM-dependent methyltransferase [Deltaproteobacteria bacterium]